MLSATSVFATHSSSKVKVDEHVACREGKPERHDMNSLAAQSIALGIAGKTSQALLNLDRELCIDANHDAIHRLRELNSPEVSIAYSRLLLWNGEFQRAHFAADSFRKRSDSNSRAAIELLLIDANALASLGHLKRAISMLEQHPAARQSHHASNNELRETLVRLQQRPFAQISAGTGWTSFAGEHFAETFAAGKLYVGDRHTLDITFHMGALPTQQISEGASRSSIVQSDILYRVRLPKQLTLGLGLGFQKENNTNAIAGSLRIRPTLGLEWSPTSIDPLRHKANRTHTMNFILRMRPGFDLEAFRELFNFLRVDKRFGKHTFGVQSFSFLVFSDLKGGVSETEQASVHINSMQHLTLFSNLRSWLAFEMWLGAGNIQTKALEHLKTSVHFRVNPAISIGLHFDTNPITLQRYSLSAGLGWSFH